MEAEEAARYRRFQLMLMLVCALLVMVYVGSAGVAVERTRERTLQIAAAGLAATARAASVSTGQILNEADTLLRGINLVLATVYPAAPLSDPAVGAVLRGLGKESPDIRGLVLIDAAGRVVNRAARPDGPTADPARQPVFASPPATAGLFVGAPGQRQGGAGEWSVPVARALRRDGRLAGGVAAAIPAAIFMRGYDRIAPDDAIGIELLGRNGVVVAAVGTEREPIGQISRFAAAATAAAVRHRATATSGAAELGVSVLPQLPLIVVTARNRLDILRRWRGERTASTAASAMFILVIGALCWLAVRALGRQQVAVAELQRSEERLKRESTLLQSTIENIGDGLSVFDRDGRLVAANRRFGALLDLPLALSTGAVLRDILMLQARRGDFGPVDPETEVALRFERFFGVLPAYRERTTEAGRVLQIRRHGMPGGSVVTVYADITELKAGDRQMSEARRLAEEANRAKSDFLANMSHELRTPLNAIIGFSEVIGNEVLGPLRDRRYLEYVNDIRASGLHLLSIINDVLDMSKIEAGKAELVPERLSVARTVAAAVRVMHERAAGRGIALAVEIAADRLEIRADERAMRQILLNLLSNAIKFSEIGATVAVRAAAAAAGRAVITIEDHGLGMTAEELERALQPFGQVAGGTSRAYGGVGLGLPICRGLVDAQGGTLTITSARGSGTTVRIVMPAYDGAADPAPSAGTPPAGIGGASSAALPRPSDEAPGTAGFRE